MRLSRGSNRPDGTIGQRMVRRARRLGPQSRTLIAVVAALAVAVAVGLVAVVTSSPIGPPALQSGTAACRPHRVPAVVAQGAAGQATRGLGEVMAPKGAV